MIGKMPGVSELCAGFLLALIVAVLLFSGMQSSHSAWTNVAQEWDRFRLNDGQKQWFKSIRAPNGVPCCDISDGHPTDMRRQVDGIYIPDPIHLQEPRQWIKVPDEAIVKGATNPIGVATVWYVPQGSDTIYIRCFAPEAET